MALVSLKCPNCSGNIQMDDSKEKGFCMYCGSDFLVKDEIYRIYVEHSGSVELSRKTEIENLIIRAHEKANVLITNTSLLFDDFEKERHEINDKYIEKILDIDAKNIEALGIRNELEGEHNKRIQEGQQLQIKNMLDRAGSFYEAAKSAAEKYIKTDLYVFIQSSNKFNNIINPDLKKYKDEFYINYDKYIEYYKDFAAQLNNFQISEQLQSLKDYKIKVDNYRADGKTSGCYIATAVYGSYDCQEVWTLRRFRDNYLALTWYGRTFIRVYYNLSPTIVKWFGHTIWFNRFWKVELNMIVGKLQRHGIENTPYKDII